jgi:LPXTG-motif cell wall-anchored protein
VPPTNTAVLDVIAVAATPVPPDSAPPAPSATPTRQAEAQPSFPKLPHTGDEDYALAYYLLGLMGSLVLSVVGAAVWRTARRRPEDEYTLKLK